MTTTQTTLGPRPAPSKISFAADCFAVDGTTTTYVVGRSALHSGPARFDSIDAATDYARKVNRPVEVWTSPRLVRVRWY